MALYEKRLMENLARIEGEVAELGRTVEKALSDAVKASLTGDRTLANETVLGDKRVNRKHEEINELCYEFMAVHLPTAGHLREVASILRVVNELERIGDYAVTIAREALQLPHLPEGVVREDMVEMADLAQTCLARALEAFLNKDAALAQKTWALASQARERIDTINTDLVREYERQDEGIRYLIDMMVTTYRLKRVSERTKNICSATEFTVTGHTGPQKTHKVLFLDPGNNCQSLIAEAVARRSFADVADFASAGRAKGTAPDPALLGFLKSKGLGRRGAKPRVLGAGAEDAAAFDVVVSLEGPLGDYFDEQPFRTVFLEWDVGKAPKKSAKAEDRYLEIYREITARVRDLMETLSGKETP